MWLLNLHPKPRLSLKQVLYKQKRRRLLTFAVTCSCNKILDISYALFAWLSRTFSANEQYFSLATNQPTVLSAMTYQPSEQGKDVVVSISVKLVSMIFYSGYVYFSFLSIVYNLEILLIASCYLRADHVIYT